MAGCGGWTTRSDDLVEVDRPSGTGDQFAVENEVDADRPVGELGRAVGDVMTAADPHNASITEDRRSGEAVGFFQFRGPAGQRPGGRPWLAKHGLRIGITAVQDAGLPASRA